MNICGHCSKEFVPKKRNIGRLCSRPCIMRFVEKIRIQKRKEFLLAESEEDRKIRLKERYEKYVIKNGDEYCWDWSSAKSRGYGYMSFDGKKMLAHRMSWEIHNGKIPPDLCCLHICDTRECSNPKHLFLGTMSDNAQDMVKKGRAANQGISVGPNTILNEKKVGKIKTLLKKGVHAMCISRDYKVSESTIRHIKFGRTWKSVKSC